MSFSLTALKTELTTDPQNYGYSGLVAIRNDDGLAQVINFPRDGVTACPVNGVVGPAITVFRNDITPREIINSVASGDFVNAQQIQISKLNILFQAAPLDATLPNLRANVQGVFASGSAATKTALVNVAQRSGSRAEDLWGTGFVVQTTDVSNALNH